MAQAHSNARANALHYAQSVDFMGMFEAGTFEEEVETDCVWMGFNRGDDGLLELQAEFVYDAVGLDSGKGWYL